MGMWDIKPWDNDEAADWYGDLMDKTGLRAHWLEGINSHLTDEADTVRAAVGLFLMLGRVYIWPIDNYDEDLEVTIIKAECLLDVPEYSESPELLAQLQLEVEELRSRRKTAEPESGGRGSSQKPSKWWQFWK